MGLSLVLTGWLLGQGLVSAKPKPAPPPAEVIAPSGLEPILGPSPAVRQEVESVDVPPVTLPTLERQGTPPNPQEVEFRLVPVPGPAAN
ncbi:MAG: hypothetical protein Q6J33_03425 [Gloeomargarita sp. DG_2_bins_126]